MSKQTWVAVAALAAAPAVLAEQEQTPSLQDMWRLVKEQQVEIRELKRDLNNARSQLANTDAQLVATADAFDSFEQSSNSLFTATAKKNQTTLGGYGEVLYNNTTSDQREINELDVQRFIFYVDHQFSDKARLVSETEIEHALSGDGDDKPGEIEIEQAYIEYDVLENMSLRGGALLVPVGILNETHEPNTFFGTERNLVESRIIPSTWTVGGAQVTGQIAPGWNVDLMIHDGLNLTRDGTIRSARQKIARSDFDNIAYTGRVRYTGVTGLELGFSLQYQEDLTQNGSDRNGRPSFVGDTVDGFMYAFHLAYQNGPWGLRALYAAWNIDGDIEDLQVADSSGQLVNAGFEGRDELYGFYVEPSYRLNDRWGFFLRLSEADERAGTTFEGDSRQRQYDFGVNYWLTSNIVLKADYQYQDNENADTNSDGFNLGIGWSF